MKVKLRFLNHNKKCIYCFVIYLGTKRFPAHRLVLSAGSEYFAAMFTSALRESAQSEVELMGVDGDALWALVCYCYTGTSFKKKINEYMIQV